MDYIFHVSRSRLIYCLFAFFVSFPVPLAVSQETPPQQTLQSFEVKPIEYIEVVSVDGLTKDQLYSAALAWFGETFRSAKNVLDFQDREAGRIVGKPLFQYEPTVFIGSARIRGVVRYSITIEVKDGRYRYIIGNFLHEGTPGPGGAPASFNLLTTALKCPYSIDGPTSSGTQETWEHLKLLATYEANKLIGSLKTRMWKVYQQLPFLNPRRKIDCEVYDRFFSIVTPTNISRRISVLTTNYDILYEYFSWKHGGACAYPISWDKAFSAGHGCEPYIFQTDCSNDKAIVCKLHGSVNFFENRSVADNSLYVAADLGDENPIGKSGMWIHKPALLAVDSIWNIRKKYGNGFTPTIIPPSYAKLGRRPWLRTLWNMAFEALKNAKTIIFLGYSIPDSDGFMRALIHGAMAQRSCDVLPSVYVVDPCDKVHSRYREIFGSSLKGLKPQDLKTAIDSELPRVFGELA